MMADSIQYTSPKPMNENISCVLSDVSFFFLYYTYDCSENAAGMKCFTIMAMSG